MLTKLFSRFTSDLNSLTTPNPQYFTNWQMAAHQSDGYATVPVLESIVKASQAVSQGDALYDRDGVKYHSFAENAHLIKALRHVLEAEGRFQVLDFGGALGSLYRQHRWFLSDFVDFVWCVVEQKLFVETGKQLFENRKLKFEATIGAAFEAHRPNIAVVSHALQRIEHPFEALNEIAQLDIPYLFIEMPMIRAGENRITQSTFPARSCKATYPIWLFAETEFKEKLQQYYHILNEFDANDAHLNLNGVRHLGFFCEKKKG
jgi:putative methyltransferase (TIGR04325 family)